MPVAKRSDRESGDCIAGVPRWYRHPAFACVFVAQLLVALAASIVASIWSAQIAVSMLLGAGVCLGGTAYSGCRVFRGQAESPEMVLSGLYAAEIGKLAVAVLFLAGVMATVKDVNLIALCSAYVGVQICGNIVAAFTTPTGLR